MSRGEGLPAPGSLGRLGWLLLAGLLRRWTGSVRAALRLAPAAAGNPRFLAYAANGLAELPFLALLLWSLNRVWPGRPPTAGAYAMPRWWPTCCAGRPI
jgi:hypothetical protein